MLIGIDGILFSGVAYLCDVYVLPAYQGRGLGRWLMQCVMGSRQLQGLRRWMLVTRDAHRLYEEAGFRVAGNPERIMEIVRPGLYLAAAPPDERVQPTHRR